MSQEIMTRQDKRRNTATHQSRIWLLAGCCFLGLIGCTDKAKNPDQQSAATDKGEKPLMLTGSEAQPKIEVSGGERIADGFEYDFGSTEVGQEFNHEFQIKNVGDGLLELTKGTASCMTCTSAVIDNDKLKPGETATFKMKWVIKSENPQFRQYVPVTANFPVLEPMPGAVGADAQPMGPQPGPPALGDPTKPRAEIRFFVKGQVVQKVMLRPTDKWDMGNVNESEPLKFSGTIYSSLLDKFEIASIKTGNPKLVVTPTPFSPEKLAELKAKVGYDLNAVLANDIPIGEFTDKVSIEIRSPNLLTLSVDIVAKRSGPIEILGNNWDSKRMLARLGSFDATKDFKQKLSLYTRGFADELKIKKITTPDPRFTAEIVPDTKFNGATKEHRRYELFIKYKGSDKEADYPLQTPLDFNIETTVPKVDVIKLKILSQGTLRD
jgi:hypothetical protein